MRNSRVGYNDNNSGSIFDVIRHLMLDGKLFSGDFCYQITLDLGGSPDNVFRMLFNVKSNILQSSQTQQLTHIY